MTTAQVVETSVTVNNNSPIQDYVHLDDQTQPTFEMTPRFKPFTEDIKLLRFNIDNESETIPFSRMVANLVFFCVLIRPFYVVCLVPKAFK